MHTCSMGGGFCTKALFQGRLVTGGTVNDLFVVHGVCEVRKKKRERRTPRARGRETECRCRPRAAKGKQKKRARLYRNGAEEPLIRRHHTAQNPGVNRDPGKSILCPFYPLQAGHQD